MSNKQRDKTITYDNGDEYRGQVDEEDQPNGNGIYTSQRGVDDIQQSTYNGRWRNGQKHGRGTHIYANGDVYDGPWQDGKKHGSNGKYTYHNSPSHEYTGGWVANMKHGHGIMIFANGDIYDGNWRNSNMEDEQASYTYADKSTYVGKYTVFLHLSMQIRKNNSNQE